MNDPVTTADGFSYEREAIVNWFRDHTTSPLTGAPLKHLELIPNLALRSAIQQLVDEKPEFRRQLYQPSNAMASGSPSPPLAAPTAPEQDPGPEVDGGGSPLQWDDDSLQAAAAIATTSWQNETTPHLELKVSHGEVGARLSASVTDETGLAALVSQICSESRPLVESLSLSAPTATGFGE